jgi:hypothetical protein
MITILFVHLGSAEPPSHLATALQQTAEIAPKSRVVLLSNKLTLDFPEIRRLSNKITLVSVEEIPPSSTTLSFESATTLDKVFRNGFWFRASERFYRIADYLEVHRLTNCLHLENDVQLYFDPSEVTDVFERFSSVAVPLDRIRAIPGLVWLKDATAARLLTEYILQYRDLNDMIVLGQFCAEKKGVAKPLPSIPTQYAQHRGLSTERYCLGTDVFQGIFDCAAIGQYLGGGHWLNDPSDTRFFINESSDLNMLNFNFSWSVINRMRKPNISYADSSTPVLAIHVHSKNMAGLSPTNNSVQTNASEIVTGERLQALCDLTISSSQVTAFHGREKIKSSGFIELPEKIEGWFFKKTRTIIPPGEEFLTVCRAAKTIFVYTHLLDYFETYIAPRLHNDFVLVTHNSDDAVGLSRLALLNHPNLVAWFAQNAHVAHSKLHPLPIGMANSQWGENRVKFLFEQSQDLAKSKLVYANFSVATHPSRVAALSAATSSPAVTVQSGVSFEDYVIELAKHKFCLCPRGNGLDTHRFWEAQYLDCIPIIVKDDWIPAYSGLPILVLDSWGALATANLDEMYIRITTTAFDRRSLKMNHYVQRITNALGAD